MIENGRPVKVRPIVFEVIEGRFVGIQGGDPVALPSVKIVFVSPGELDVRYPEGFTG